MYRSVNSCVKLTYDANNYFACKIDVQQGAVFSPLLFSLFLNDLETELGRTPFQGVELGTRKINSLLYADDMVILSDTQEGLQLLLKIFENYCNRWRLAVNTNKANI